ncbi:MAG: hypothetical protein ISR87_07410 [Candidatus Marinimicrobia bacterium]|nr:hypothetical protein [FCB group bacterium]MBL7025271.1 hypothetical protein [Candidatus Neomarinimicrobiota bacterium]
MRKTMCLFICITSIWAQTTSNPDFSVIGQLSIQRSDSSVALNGADLELAITGYLNPYARAEVYLHKHNVSAALEVEEAVLTIERGLPFGTAARIGHLRPSLGLINREHEHLWPFIVAPKSAVEIAGEEMWSGTGAEFSWLLPLPWAVDVSLGAFSGGLSAEEHGHEESAEDHSESGSGEPPVCVGRLGNFFELGQVTHLGIGSSFYLDPDENRKILNLDSKLRWRPDSYRGLTIQGEVFFNLADADSANVLIEEGHSEALEYSTYAFANYKFNRKWNIGLMLDGLKHEGEEIAWSPGVFFGFSPVEESTVLRVVLQNNTHDDKSDLLTLIQLIWSLGPHKPHSF